MALVQIPPIETRVRWDRATDRPSHISWNNRHLRVVGLDAVRDERAAFPAERGPRVTLVLRTHDGGRASIAFDGRRWYLEAVEQAA
ncbi:MAG TPA: hypothetical protein VF295_00115 [Candidatus Limnocylindria bacterium]|jgi:hypothetical protein